MKALEDHGVSNVSHVQLVQRENTHSGRDAGAEVAERVRRAAEGVQGVVGISHEGEEMRAEDEGVGREKVHQERFASTRSCRYEQIRWHGQN